MLDELGLEGTQQILRVAECWPEVVGAEAARHCWPHRLAGAVLEAEADSSAWLHALRLEAPGILARLAEVLGPAAPRELRLRLGTRPRPEEQGGRGGGAADEGGGPRG